MRGSRGQRRLVSVVLSTFNGERVVGDAIDSLLSQTHADVEIVVIDDGSTDASWNVLQRYAPRVRSFRQPNGGLAAARNAGLGQARGEYLALMDHDDICEPDRLEWQLRCLDQLPDTVLCSSDFSAFDAHGHLADSYCSTYYSRCSERLGGVRARYPRASRLESAAGVQVAVYHGHVFQELALGNFVHPPTVMFRRALLDEIGPFDPGIGPMCDWEWLLRAGREGELAHIDRPLLRYRRSETQMTSRTGQASGVFSALSVVSRLEADPQLAGRRPRLRRLRGELLLDAAYKLAESDRLRSLVLLGQGLLLARRQASRALVTLTLARALVPAALRARLRRSGPARRGRGAA